MEIRMPGETGKKLRFAGTKEEVLDSWNWRNRLAEPIWPPGAIPVMCGALIHEKCCFSYLSRSRNRPAVV